MGTNLESLFRFGLYDFVVKCLTSVLLGLFPLVGTSGLEPPTSRLSGVRSNHLSYAPMLVHGFFGPSLPYGGDEEDRTPDPLRARQVLSQLSYTPICFRVKVPFLILL